ncbi:hypothetical protein Mgra_00003715 [Meloidogyne graminicola]|uniref:Uncharacterized protein n=1 Tax=Meloidogyne graminicola TaxID=189291 RepID=A0A8S9ZT87_9BILA|nr:hypothetical protein Mgra_00003715 [Meloidogyne graminicola]
MNKLLLILIFFFLVLFNVIYAIINLNETDNFNNTKLEKFEAEQQEAKAQFLANTGIIILTGFGLFVKFLNGYSNNKL